MVLKNGSRIFVLVLKKKKKKKQARKKQEAQTRRLRHRTRCPLPAATRTTVRVHSPHTRAHLETRCPLPAEIATMYAPLKCNSSSQGCTHGHRFVLHCVRRRKGADKLGRRVTSSSARKAPWQKHYAAALCSAEVTGNHQKVRARP